MAGRPDQHSTTASFIPSCSRPELALHIHLARRLCSSKRRRCNHTWVAGAGRLARQPSVRLSRRFYSRSHMSITQRVLPTAMLYGAHPWVRWCLVWLHDSPYDIHQLLGSRIKILSLICWPSRSPPASCMHGVTARRPDPGAWPEVREHRRRPLAPAAPSMKPRQRTAPSRTPAEASPSSRTSTRPSRPAPR